MPFSDDFSASGALTATGWTAFNAASVPDAAKSGGQYNSGEIAAVGSTTWFNADRGRADWKLVAFPHAGAPDKEIVAINVGVGPSSNPAANLGGGTEFAFCGLVVHLDDTSDPNYEFCVPGVRTPSPGNTRATIESKTTINGTSTPDDLGADPVGAGVTHADIRLTLRSDHTIRWAYRVANSGGAWTPIDFGEGSGVSAGGGLTYTSGSAWVGLVTYGFDSVPVPFIGTCDSLTLVDETSGADVRAMVLADSMPGQVPSLALSIVMQTGETLKVDVLSFFASGACASDIDGALSEAGSPVGDDSVGRCQTFYKQNCTAGTHVVTFTPSSGNHYLSMVAKAFSGVVTTGGLHVAAVQRTQTGTTTPSTGNIVTSARCLIDGFMGNAFGASGDSDEASGTGWTELLDDRPGASFHNRNAQYRVSDAGTYNCDWSNAAAGSVVWLTRVVAFAEAVSAVAPRPIVVSQAVHRASFR